VISKSELRKSLRAARREHAEAQPDSIRALLFHAPPRPLLAKIETGAVIGLYHANAHEAPAAGYARYFHENGHAVALPRIASESAAMVFARHTDPFAGDDLEPGPFGLLQPGATAQALIPDVVFVPLVGFTPMGKRLGQGGGHYDRWLAEHPGVLKIGLAWDIQRVEPEDRLPTQPHDVPLDAVVTPTRIYGSL
jgi:5-formyltetrahydrofolate cyclo-ligase